ncbi:hypothetical protein [Methylobacterium gnaphalii]|uniref:Uncharacterized protein n=1 Tax=Methylobacterium gnaphalii TaxID=1010610 RepID=A0A512JPD0_9HYPH|nr:hypothetical protein [Methylobacterium gnaphalii]GEP11799.1 hypothetical protein MGN01_36440 [Methylobacterium gnaphalii]GJD69476.1 hypothetical protein MMMDOFMJ_2407 [Methylobacterium gnaphalii]GLS49566.1 hypothetical protein GCM10007885_24150 [Methylobacterium gnaphalii]
MTRRLLGALAARLSPFRMFGPRFDLAAPPRGRGACPLDAAAAASAVATWPAASPRALIRLGLLALVVESAAESLQVSIDGIDRIEAMPRPNGKSHGLEWARDDMALRRDQLRQGAALLRRLAPHEAAVRDLLAGEVVS